jgi:hypothetical protein
LTDGSGQYSFNGVALTGSYVVTASASSFQTLERKDIQLRAGITAVLDFTLGVSGQKTEVNVYGTTETLPTESDQPGTRLDVERIQNTPILNRKITSLPLLDSQVRESHTTGDLFINETLFVVNGTGRRQTPYYIDNTVANDSWGRQTMFTALPYEAVQEFTLVTNSLSAEYGFNAGAAVNVVTKSGSNDWHGDFVGMGRPAFSDANQPLTIKRAVNTLAQGSGAFSGPMVKDKTYFLVSAEYTNQNRDAVITSPVDPGAIYTGDFSQTLFLARLDQKLSNNNWLTARANFDRFSDTNPQDTVSGLTLPAAARVFARRTYEAALSDTATISSSTLNEARFQLQVGSPITQFLPVTPGPQLAASGAYTYGDSRVADLLNHQYEFADTLSALRGHHNLKAGFDVIYSSSGGYGQEFGSGYIDGRFTINPQYATLPISEVLTLNPGLPPPGAPPGAPPLVTSYNQSFGNANYNVKETLWALFLQDNWNIRPNLTLNLGVRWDGQTFTDKLDNIAPRVGLVWKVPGNTILRAGYGIYYSEERTDLYASSALGGPQGVFTYTVAPGGLDFPTSFAPLPQFPQGTTLPPRDITILAGQCGYLNQFLPVDQLRFCPNSLLNPQTQQWNVGLEHELAPGWMFSMDYIGSHTIHIEQPVDLNSPAAFVRTAPGQIRSVADANATRPIVPEPNGYRQVLAYTNVGTSFYDGLQVKLNRQFTQKFSMLFSYTWSHTIDTVEWDGTGQNPNDYSCLVVCEKATSLLDQRNRAALSGTYMLPWNFMFGANMQLGSGYPYNVTTGVDNNGDGNNSDRPVVNGVVVPRDWGQGTAIYDFDFSLQKTFRVTERTSLSLRAESFNTFNHQNIYGRNSVYGNGATPVPSFGVPVGGLANIGPPREMQFMARITF